ncbi:hypothetical protein GPECTOR_45g161 [Gonium pectorale]|uniref:Uncharacterized protein n=1 Tax=Gonium pectorale TaxID=33097 RepID=A0A150G900_GONPE|nr:hypothetical protein GPECTOR_45g161 [Gonium pectorale]|eukprot:KXZ46291.1 hypothetical protein GPECTOR_45g161 [Gonium pectorale]
MRSVRKRGPAWLRATVHFACDVLLPTGFFGPLAGVTLGAMQLTGCGPGAMLQQVRGAVGGGGGRAAPEAPHQPALASALPAVAAAAGDAMAAATSGAVAAVSDAVAAAAVGGLNE